MEYIINLEHALLPERDYKAQMLFAIAERLEHIAELMEKRQETQDEAAQRAEQEENHQLWLTDREDELRRKNRY